MTSLEWIQIVVYFVALLALVKPLGSYMAAIYSKQEPGPAKVLKLLESVIYKLSGIDPNTEMSWADYAKSMLLFNAAGLLLVYAILRTQQWMPWNPQSFGPLDPHTAWNIAVSFATNTNWQNYGGETVLSYFSQMSALTVQNFVSAASGMAVAAALARGLSRRQTKSIGNFWSDLIRSTIYVLLPLSLVLAIVLASQGVVQNLHPYQTASLTEPTTGEKNAKVTEQLIPMGPAASQIAIKQLGTNGGGFFNANSAHPFENPTPLSNFLQMLSIILIPAAFCFTFGQMVNDKRQGWALLAVMLIIFLPLMATCIGSETATSPVYSKLGISGPNMEGKEVRIGIMNSGLWAAATTAASNGSVNSMHDSYLPLGGAAQLFLMQLGEVIFGGVGSGLYGLVVFAILAVFLAGLMVGRTPEYLGKKIEAFEMKMASLMILVPPACSLIGTAVGVVSVQGIAALFNHGPHGFSEILYAFTSMGNNNGSAFGGYSANAPLINTVGGIAMLASRYWVALPVLAIAGSLAAKKTVPPSAGTLPTHSGLFVMMLAGTVVIVGALAFIPALALGPIVEHLRLMK